MTRHPESAESCDDEGSVLILTLGYAALAIVAILICAAATTLYLAQKRVDGVADAAALAAADGFVLTVVDGEPLATLTDEGVRSSAELFIADLASDVTVVSAGTPDGVSARVTVAASWHPPFITLFVPDGVALEATATSRTALR